jgi:hypothetical protein
LKGVFLQEFVQQSLDALHLKSTPEFLQHESILTNATSSTNSYLQSLAWLMFNAHNVAIIAIRENWAVEILGGASISVDISALIAVILVRSSSPEETSYEIVVDESQPIRLQSHSSFVQVSVTVAQSAGSFVVRH